MTPFAISRRWPETYARIRAACQCAAKGIDLDAYAAQLTLTVEMAKLKKRKGLA